MLAFVHSTNKYSQRAHSIPVSADSEATQKDMVLALVDVTGPSFWTSAELYHVQAS